MKTQLVTISISVGLLMAGTVHSSISAVQKDGTSKTNTQVDSDPNIGKTLKPNSLGMKVSVNYECLDKDATDEANISVLPSGQALVGICDVLFMLDANERLVWEYNVPQMLFDFAFIPSTGLIYGTAGDNSMFILEASTGKELVRNSRNGSAAYGQVKRYGNDVCLITDNNWGYRERLDDPTIKDGVSAWRGTELLWSAELPPSADLMVKASRIVALTKTKDGIFIKEIPIPKTKSDRSIRPTHNNPLQRRPRSEFPIAP